MHNTRFDTKIDLKNVHVITYYFDQLFFSNVLKKINQPINDFTFHCNVIV